MTLTHILIKRSYILRGQNFWFEGWENVAVAVSIDLQWTASTWEDYIKMVPRQDSF